MPPACARRRAAMAGSGALRSAVAATAAAVASALRIRRPATATAGRLCCRRPTGNGEGAARRDRADRPVRGGVQAESRPMARELGHHTPPARVPVARRLGRGRSPEAREHLRRRRRERCRDRRGARRRNGRRRVAARLRQRAPTQSPPIGRQRTGEPVTRRCVGALATETCARRCCLATTSPAAG